MQLCLIFGFLCALVSDYHLRREIDRLTARERIRFARKFGWRI
jgi:hypothetical protein